MEGWLSKMGPKNEPFRRRWFTLDRRKLMYFEEPLVSSNYICMYGEEMCVKEYEWRMKECSWVFKECRSKAWASDHFLIFEEQS